MSAKPHQNDYDTGNWQNRLWSLVDGQVGANYVEVCTIQPL